MGYRELSNMRSKLCESLLCLESPSVRVTEFINGLLYGSIYPFQIGWNLGAILHIQPFLSFEVKLGYTMTKIIPSDKRVSLHHLCGLFFISDDTSSLNPSSAHRLHSEQRS
jgi:hypothetical protein